jgi:hypothetical protein
MAENSVSDFTSLINQQVSSREKLTVCLAKLEALVTIGKHCDLSEILITTTHEYFWALSDYVDQAIKSNDDALNLLLKFSKP